MSKRSDVWNHFEDVGDGKARCRLCRADIGCRGGSTSSMRKHVEHRHTHVLSSKPQSATASGNSPSLTVPGMFSKTSITSARSEKLSDLIATMIAVDTLPISFVEGAGFKQLMAYAEPGYVVPCAKTMKKRLHSRYEKAKEKVRAMLAQAPTVALTTDCWTSGATESFISLSAHYACITTFVMKSWVLATRQFDGRHTGSHIKTKLEEMMIEWGISDKTSTMVHDNAANMNLASAMSDSWNPLGCSNHTLQLAVNHALEKSKVTDVISAACRLVAHFRHSVVATGALCKQQERMGLPCKKLMMHSKTRWNSAFDMLLRLHENRWAVSAVLADQLLTKPAQAKALELTNAEWHIIASICPVLDPIKLATATLSAEENVSVSIVLPSVAGLLEKAILEDDDPETVQEFKAEFQQQLTSRFRLDALYQKEVTTLHKATFLDPRFVCMSFVTSATKALVIKVLQKEITAYSTGTSDQMSTTSSDTPQPTATSSTAGLLDSSGHAAATSDGGETRNQHFVKKARVGPTAAEILLTSVQNASQQQQQQQDEVMAYSQEPPANINTNPLEWWKTNGRKYPKLTVIALKYLGIPATSVPSERIFSKADEVVSRRRASLKPSTVELLVFLSKNMFGLDD